MRKKYLGIVCLIYSALIIYVKLNGYLGNFLAPQMQKYILGASILLIIIGLVFLFNDHIHYEFKVSDLILILPLIMLIFAGDGRLSMNLANNRANGFNNNSNQKKEVKVSDNEDKKIEKEKEIKIDTKEEEKMEEPKVDFSNVDYDVKDEAYSLLSNVITYSENVDYYVGKKIRVRGFIKKSLDGFPKQYMAFGKYVISCCAADAGMGGFIISYDKDKVKDNNWYEIEGIIEKGKDDYGDIAVIKVINIKDIDRKKELQNVYPCYAYGDGSCSVMDEYDIYN